MRRRSAITLPDGSRRASVEFQSQPHPLVHCSSFFADSFLVGTWLSLVEHSLGVRGVGSSNLPVPTKNHSSSRKSRILAKSARMNPTRGFQRFANLVKDWSALADDFRKLLVNIASEPAISSVQVCMPKMG